MGGDGRMAINWEVNLRKNRRLYRRKLSCCPRSRNLDMFSVLQRAADVVGPSLSTIGCQQHGHRKCGLLQVDVRPHGGMLGSRPCVVADFEWLGRFQRNAGRLGLIHLLTHSQMVFSLKWAGLHFLFCFERFFFFCAEYTVYKSVYIPWKKV